MGIMIRTKLKASGTVPGTKKHWCVIDTIRRYTTAIIESLDFTRTYEIHTSIPLALNTSGMLII